MSSLRLHEVILYVHDMRTQIEFYRDILGLEVSYPSEMALEGELHWVTFKTGHCTLALHSGGMCQFGNDAPRFVFEVEDIQRSRQDLIDHKVLVSEIRSPVPGIMVFDALDPEGNRFSFESVQKKSL